MPAVLDQIKNIVNPKKHDELHAGAEGAPAPTAADAASAAPKPRFDRAKVTVIFVLGGPGAGKGTQSEKLVAEYGFSHLSAGDLLRAEQNREGSQYGELIRTYIREGNIVPMEVTIKLLENAMVAALGEAHDGPGWDAGHGRFLIDGFPRKMDQALKFEEDVCPAALVLFYTTTEKVLLERLLERGKTSGREDDNAESIVKRFRTYHETTMPVIDHYKKEGRVAEVDASPPIDEVYASTRPVIDKALAGEFGKKSSV